MGAEIIALADITGVELMRVPVSSAADFGNSPPENLVRFPGDIPFDEYRQFQFPTGEILPLNGFKALYLEALTNTDPDNPLLDEVARQALRKPNEEIPDGKLQSRLSRTRKSLREMLDGYGIPYSITECFHEVAPNELRSAAYLRPRNEETSVPIPEEEVGTLETTDDVSGEIVNEQRNSPVIAEPMNTLAQRTTGEELSQTPNSPSQDTNERAVERNVSIPLAIQLRALLETNQYTYAEIISTLFPGIPLPEGRKKLHSPMLILKLRLAKEGKFIPDGRSNREGIATIRSLTISADNNHLPEGDETFAENVGMETTEITPEKPSPTSESDDETPKQTQNPDLSSAQAETEKSGDVPESYDQTPTQITYPSDDNTPVDEEAATTQIQDPIERRVATRKSGKTKLVFFTNPDVQGRVTAQIEITGRGKTPKLELTGDEAMLFEAIFTSATPFTHERLEMAMVDVARSDIFEKVGGFEKVFNTLNRKLHVWRIGIDFNENSEFILVNGKLKPLALTPLSRNNEEENLKRNEGRQRRRQPSHGKLRL